MPFADFPWFRKATVEQILAVERPTEGHRYWPQIDIAVAVESLRRPEAFSLIAKGDT